MEQFRALRTDGSGWEYYTERCHIPFRFIPRASDFKRAVDMSTLGRYTGRKDRHGQLIFGGDIIEDDGVVYRVCFVNHFPMIHNEKYGYQPIDNLDFEFCKILGNRYETAERDI